MKIETDVSREKLKEWIECLRCYEDIDDVNGHTKYEDLEWMLAEMQDMFDELPVPYDPKYGDDRMCKCGHPYYRHFDTYDDMYPCGCKYCGCEHFVEG